MSLKKIYLWAVILPLVVSALISILILIFLKFLPPKMPLYYSLAWGEGQLTTQKEFFILPGILTLLALLNLLVSWYLHQAQAFFKKILLVGTLTLTVILITTFIKIVLTFI